MKKGLKLALLLTMITGGLLGQAPGSNKSQIVLEANAPDSVISANAQVIGSGGSRQFFYWVIASFPIGKSVPFGPAQVTQVPDTLTGSNYVRVVWSPVNGATSYDVLRTTSPVLPNTTANIAVATDVSGTSFNNTAETINSYTISAASTAQDFWRLDNRNYQLPVTLFGSAPIVPSFIGTSLPSRCVIGQQFFKTDATPGGNLYLCTALPGTWTAITGGGGGTSPGGTNGQLQYNNAGAFGGTGATWNGTYVLYPQNQGFGWTASDRFTANTGGGGNLTYTSAGVSVLRLDRDSGGWLIGKSNSAIFTGTLSVLDRTGTTGATLIQLGSDGTNTSATSTIVNIRSGQIQGGAAITNWLANSGTVVARVYDTGNVDMGNQLLQTSSTGANHVMNTTNATTRTLFNRLQISGVDRWVYGMGLPGNTSENFTVARYSGGVFQESSIDVSGATGDVSIAKILTSSNLKRGSGSPESVVSGIVGDLYQRLDGGTGTTLYIKEAGVGTTGWVPVISGGGGSIPSTSITDLTPTLTSSTTVTIAPGRWGHGTSSMAPHAGTTVNITTINITGASNTSPIQLTVPSILATSLRTGDTVMVNGVTGNTAANGTWIIEVVSSTQINLTGSTGNGEYISGGTIAGTGSGTAIAYGDPQGNINVLAPSGAGLVLTCPTVCIMNQATNPVAALQTTATDATQITSITIVNGAFTAVSDDRRFLNSGWNCQALQGITTSNAAGTCSVGVDSTVARTTGTNQYTGSNDFTPATRTAPNRTGAGAPAPTCTIGDTYFRTSGVTAGSNLYLCTAVNTWTQLTIGGSSAPSFTSTTSLVDEFIQGGSSTLYGQLSWRGAVSQGSGTVTPIAGVANHPGLLNIATSATNGDGTYIDLRGSGGTINSTSGLDGTGGVGYQFNTIFRTDSASAANGRIEFGWFDNTPDSALNMVGINFIPSIPQTTFQCTVMVAGVRTYVDTTVTVANNTWYNVALGINSAGVLTCTVNGTTVTNSATFPTVAVGPAIWLQNMASGARNLTMDWVNMQVPNGGR